MTQPDENVAAEEKVVAQTFLACKKCFSEIAPGKQHRCSEAVGVAVLSQRLIKLGENFGNADSRAYQRVASTLTKHQMEKENVARGEEFRMATGIISHEQVEREKEKERKRV